MTATDRAYAWIRDAIANGVYGAGDRLPEVELASEAGISRTPVREALRRLDSEGIVELLPNRGSRVAGWSAHDLDEAFELRSQLEGYGARLAAQRAGTGELSELTQLVEGMEEVVAGRAPGRLDRIAELNGKFHSGVLELAGNRRLASVVQAIVQRALVARTFHLYTPQELARSSGHHRELLDALSAGDPDWAEAIMRAHIYHGRMVARRAAR